MLRSGLLHNVPHGFTTRADGDLRPGAPGQDQASVRIVGHLGGAGRLLVVHQVHGAHVVSADDILAAGERVLDADAIVSSVKGAVIAIRTADCVPILLAGRHGVAAVHAGWRGTALGVTRAALLRLQALGDNPGHIRALVGPCISEGAYEVGHDVVEALEAVAPEGGLPWRSVAANGRDHVSLARLNANILASVGVRVEILDLCTVGTTDLWSHRRDGERSGRQAGVIRWAGGAGDSPG